MGPQERVKLSCTHEFCKKCIEKWILEYSKDSCPVCRSAVSPAQCAEKLGILVPSVRISDYFSNYQRYVDYFQPRGGYDRTCSFPTERDESLRNKPLNFMLHTPKSRQCNVHNLPRSLHNRYAPSRPSQTHVYKESRAPVWKPAQKNRQSDTKPTTDIEERREQIAIIESMNEYDKTNEIDPYHQENKRDERERDINKLKSDFPGADVVMVEALYDENGNYERTKNELKKIV